MTRTELIETVAASTGLTKAEAGRVVDTIFTSLSTALQAGREVKLAGFGSFALTDRPARQGRNPRTGEVVAIAARRGIRFKPAKPLKDAVNG